MKHSTAFTVAPSVIHSAVTQLIAAAHPIYLASGLSDRRIADAVELSTTGEAIPEHLISELADAAIETGRLAEQEESDEKRAKLLRASDAAEAIHLALASLHSLAGAQEALEAAQS